MKKNIRKMMLTGIIMICAGSLYSQSTVTGTTDAYDIYIAGTIGTGDFGKDNACYWINDIRYNLSPAQSRVSALVIEGNDFYISGHYQKDGMVHPCYWKNGVLVDLDCDRTAYTSDVFILGDDVYVAGHHLQSDDITIPCFWKNGIKTDLEVPGTMSGYTKSVAADGQNSFITGFLISSGNEENQINACYWKNGELVQLNTSPYKFSIASEIILSGDATYFAGRLDDTEKECLCVWKNDSRIDYLTIPNKTSGTMFFFTWENADYGNFSYEVGVVRHKIGINSMGVYDGDIYITAEQDGNACYWMNENMTVLTEDCEDVSPDYLLVVDQNILIVGNCDKTICVWENGNKREITKLNENERPSYYGLLRK